MLTVTISIVAAASIVIGYANNILFSSILLKTDIFLAHIKQKAKFVQAQVLILSNLYFA